MINPSTPNRSNVSQLFSSAEALDSQDPTAQKLAGLAMKATQDSTTNTTLEEGHGYVIDGQMHPTAKAAAAAALSAVNAIHDSMSQPDDPQNMAQLPQPDAVTHDFPKAA